MTDLLEGLNDASGVVWVDFARSLNVWADPPTPGWGYRYGPGWRNTGSVQFEPVQIQFSKFSQSPNCEPELPAVVRTRTRTELELTVQFGQFGPNRWFRTELRQPYSHNPSSINSCSSDS